MTIMAEATTTFAVGDRVRLVDNSSMNAPVGSTATVTREPYTSAYSGTRLLGVQWDRVDGLSQNDGGYGADKFVSASAPEDSAPVPVPVVVGMRIRVRQESATPDYTGQPPAAYQGQYGVVNAGRMIPNGATFDDHRTVIQVDLDNGETGIGVYVGWIEPDTRPLAVGDHVRIADEQLFANEHRGYVDQSFRNRVASVIRAADDSGGVHVNVDTLGGQIIHASHLTRTTPPPAVVNPMEVGTRVATSTGKGTVISKDDERLSAYIRRAGYMSSDRYVAVIRDGEDEGQMFDLSQVNVVVDVLEGISPEQQILRLQTLVHRVASYEAVRRDWCHEVNGALAMLNLPDHLSTVDRDLGRALGRDPKLIFQLDAEVEGIPGDDEDDDDDEDTETVFRLRCDVNVSYDDNEGWSHSGTVSVFVNYTACHDDTSCIDDVESCIDNDMVRSAISAAGLPSAYALDSWDLSDWEVDE